MNLSEEVIKEIERISHERIQEINGNLDEALKYLAELKYPIAPKKFDPTGTINQYHEAKRQGAVFGMKIALTSPELLSKAGWVKKEEEKNYGEFMRSNPPVETFEQEAKRLYPGGYEWQKLERDVHIRACQMHRNDGFDELIDWLKTEILDFKTSTDAIDHSVASYLSNCVLSKANQIKSPQNKEQ